MRIDAMARFSNAQAITATAASTSSYDLGAVRQPGVGQPLYLVVNVDTAFTDSGSDSTVTVTVEHDTATGLGSVTTAQTIGTFAALSAAGTQLVALLQPNVYTKRYLQLKYTLANGNLTTGALTAFLTDQPELYTAYADNQTITG